MKLHVDRYRISVAKQKNMAIILATMLGVTSSHAVLAAGELRIAMSASDIPQTTGQADQGGEGWRFIGFTLYDGLVRWQTDSADQASRLEPSLATSWSVDPQDSQRWTFVLREGVTFHDGSAFDAESVVWNLDKLLNENAEQFDPAQARQGGNRLSSVESYKVIDANKVEIRTKAPDAMLPYNLVRIAMSSKANWENLGKDWAAVAASPSGTGPFRLTALSPRERVELVPFENHWDETRRSELDKVVLVPMPDASARTAALMSNQVDWIESPAPDALPMLASSGYNIVSGPYPHNWTWTFSFVEGSPWVDERVRKAANLAIDREAMMTLVGGYGIAAEGWVPPSSPWFGKPEFKLGFDPDAARALLAEAGFGPENPVKASALISAGGSGQMSPIPMNEYIQQSLAEVGIEISFQTVDWNTMITSLRAGAQHETMNGIHSLNFSFDLSDPGGAFQRLMLCDMVPPAGTNWGNQCDPELDALIHEAENTFDLAEQDRVLQRVHEHVVNNANFLFVAHDVAPRAMSSKVHGFVSAQTWYPSLTSVTIE